MIREPISLVFPSPIGLIYTEPLYIPIISRHRDSRFLEECNWQVAREMFEEIQSEEDIIEAQPDNYDPGWIIKRVRNPLVGWTETLYINVRAPSEVIECAASIEHALEQHPILDEDFFYEQLSLELQDVWADMGTRDRIDCIEEHATNTSIFAARRDEIPDDIGIVAYIESEVV